MKKIVSLALVLVMMLSMFTFCVSAQEYASVYIDGKKITFDVQPQIINGRTMVPMRKIFEELGATVSWDDKTETATGTKGGTVVKFRIYENKMYKNGVASSLDVAAQLIGGRTLIPLRAVSEALGCSVRWDGDTSTVYISTVKTGFDKVADYFKNNCSYYDGSYYMNKDNTIVLYSPTDNLFSIYMDNDESYELLMLIYPDGKVVYSYTLTTIDEVIEGSFKANTLTLETKRLPYSSYNGYAELADIANETATLAVQLGVLSTDLVFLSRNVDFSTADLGFTSFTVE